MIKDVTNSQKDWDDFWYNSPPINMKIDSPAFDDYQTRLSYYQSKSTQELIGILKELGFKLDQQLDTVIKQLALVISTIEEDSSK